MLRTRAEPQRELNFNIIVISLLSVLRYTSVLASRECARATDSRRGQLLRAEYKQSIDIRRYTCLFSDIENNKTTTIL